MADSLWIIGVAMTKFMRYKDKDLIDLGSEAATAALADAGLTIFDADILAAGCLYDTNGIGQRLQKQIGQTGIPVYTSPTRARPERPRSAWPRWRSRLVRRVSGSRSGWSRWARSACWVPARPRRTSRTSQAGVTVR